MRRTAVVVVVCISLVALAAAAMAQGPAPSLVPSTAPPLTYYGPPQRTHGVGASNADPVQVTVNELQLLGKWKAASESEREAVQKELRETVKRQFQVRLDVQEKEVEQLEAQVKRLREKLDLRRKKEGEIVNFRVEQLLREAQGLGWGTEPVRPPLPSVVPYDTRPAVNPPPSTYQPGYSPSEVK